MIEHDIWLESELDAPFPYEAFLRQCITKALELEQVTLPCEINVLITDNEGIHRINLEQRQVDAPTDVLSFPMFQLTPGAPPTLDDVEADPGTGLVPPAAPGGYGHLLRAGNSPGGGIWPQHPAGAGLSGCPLGAAPAGL